LKITRNSPALRLPIQVLLAVALAAAPVRGQSDNSEPPLINEVIINFTGVSNVNEEVARANMSLREGEPYNQIDIDRDIRSLYRSGLFEFIEVRVKPLSKEEVDVIFDIRPKFRISSVSFEGNERFKDFRLQRQLEFEVNEVLNERKVNEGANAIRDHYLKKGYARVEVDYEINRNPATGFGDVTYKIDEGRRLKVDKIRFIGNEKVKDGKLRKLMETKQTGLFTFIIGLFTDAGKFKSDVFEEDLQKIKEHYRSKGYLDIRIDPTEVSYKYPSRSRMVIEIPIEEGKQYSIGDISFDGNETFPDPMLLMLLDTTPGTVYDPEKLDEDATRLEDFYGRFGYLETRAGINRVPNVETGNIDIVFDIRESERFAVESVTIEGNTKTKSAVILRELALGPGTTFDSNRLEASRMRLENTRYFENVNINPQSTNIPGRKDLRITFREGRTGNFSFGAGFSSVQDALFFLELSQSNFDLLNWRGAFQGGGQKFRMKVQLGSTSSQFTVNFEEPWLFQKRLALGFSIFRSNSEFVSDFYDVLRTGFQVYIRRRLFELVEGRLAYTFENVDFDETDDLRSAISESQRRLNTASSLTLDQLVDSGGFGGVAFGDFNRNGEFDEEDRERFLDVFRNDLQQTQTLREDLDEFEGNVSSLNLLLLRDTRDRLINTFRGSRFLLDLTYTGGVLGGRQDFYKIETRNAIYLPVSRAHTQTIELLFNAGIVEEFGDSDRIPVEDRFFLGGPDDLRGFDFREVGPRTSNGLPVGGKTYAAFTAEYSIGIGDQDFRVAAFYDGGFVNRDAADFNVDNYNDNYGIGLRLNMMGSPMRIDYGIPLTTDEFNDDGAQFNFTFGGRF